MRTAVCRELSDQSESESESEDDEVSVAVSEDTNTSVHSAPTLSPPESSIGSDSSESSEDLDSEDSRRVHTIGSSSSSSDSNESLYHYNNVNPNLLRQHTLPASSAIREIDDLLYPPSVDHFDTAVENIEDLGNENETEDNNAEIEDMFGDVIENIEVLDIGFDNADDDRTGNDDEVMSNTNFAGDEDTNLARLKVQPAEVHLLYYMMIYSIPAIGYMPLMNWAYQAQQSRFDFKNASAHKTIMKHIKKNGTGRHARVIETAVTHEGLGTAMVYHFDFLSNLCKLLRDPTLMANALYQYDSVSEYYAEQNTGTWWRKAERFMKRRLKKFKVPQTEWKNHILVPIIFFIDATHCDRNGRLNAEPILMTIGNIPLELRKSASAWCMLGLLPSKIMSPEESKLQKLGTGRRCSELQLYHDCIGTVLKSLFDIQDADRRSGMGYFTDVFGLGEVHVHPEVSIYVGDTAGHDPLLAHYKAYSTPTARPCRSCDVSFQNLDNANHHCTFVESQVIERKIELYMCKVDKRKKVEKYRAKAAALSQHLMSPFIHRLSHGGDKRGAFGATPFEVLHAHLLGLLKRGMSIIFSWRILNSSGTAYRKVFNKSHFEKRVRILSNEYKRKSDRDMPRAVFNTGVTTLAGIQGQEYVGLALFTILAIPGMMHERSIEKKLQFTCGTEFLSMR